MGVLKSHGKGKGKEVDHQGMQKSESKRTTMDKVRSLHIYTKEERHGRKETLKPHPHHAKKKEPEEGEEEEDIEEESQSDAGSEPETKGKDAQPTKKANDEDELVALDRDAAMARLKTTEAGLPEVLPLFLLLLLLLSLSVVFLVTPIVGRTPSQTSEVWQECNRRQQTKPLRAVHVILR